MLVMRITKLPRGDCRPGQTRQISRITRQKLPNEDKMYFIKSGVIEYIQMTIAY